MWIFRNKAGKLFITTKPVDMVTDSEEGWEFTGVKYFNSPLFTATFEDKEASGPIIQIVERDDTYKWITWEKSPIKLITINN